MSILRRAIRHNDGNPDIGRALPAILADAGFDILSPAPTYDCAATPAAKAGMYAAMACLWKQADFVAQAESLGWINPAERSAVVKRLELEAADPGSFSGRSYAEVVAHVASS